MLRLSNIRTGTKLAVMSAISILLVIGMITAQLLGNSTSTDAQAAAARRPLIMSDSIDAKASVRGMQVGVRDLQLAATKEQLEKASKYIAARHESAVKYLTQSIQLSTTKENIYRLNTAKELADQYYAGAKEIAAIKAKILAPSSNGGADAEAANQIGQLIEKAEQIVRERTLPTAAKAEEVIDAAVAFAKEPAHQSTELAAQSMASAERISIGVGILVVILLIISAVFGVMTIGKPLRKTAGVLVELTNDRVVDVFYVTRGDEVGDIAKATEVFKQSIAEKVINLRVRAGLDVVKSIVIVADTDYNIMYMNTTLQEMMREAEPELRKALPHFDAGKLLGASMDVFHKNPAHQRKLLDSRPEVMKTTSRSALRNSIWWPLRSSIRTVSAPAPSWNGATKRSRRRSRPRSTTWSRPRSPAISPSACRSRARRTSCSISPR
jgi:hypothetical protein